MVKKISTILKEISQDARWFTASNLLTFLRIILTPIIVYGMYKQWWMIIFILFLIAALSDLFDGFFARLLDEETMLGTYLDPLADKVLLIASFVSLAIFRSPLMPIPLWFVALVLIRESIIVGGALVLMLFGAKTSIRPSLYGKLTSFFQLTFILWLFVCYFFGWNPYKTYSILIVLLAGFSFMSLCHYLLSKRHFLQIIAKKD